MSLRYCALLLWTIFTVASVDEAVDIDTADCGVNVGCYLEPLNCIYALDTCEYVLTWRVEAASVRFQLAAKMRERAPWAAVGLNTVANMPGASVVDCVVNASDNNQVIVQMSYNHHHHNHVLNERFLGLVNGSMSGTYNGSYIECTYNRVITVNSGHAESGRVMNLTEPYYLLLAQGPTNGKGAKAKHLFDPFVSSDRISLLNYTNPMCGSMRPMAVRLHVSIMVITWMLLSSCGIIASRYMKFLLCEFTVLRQQLWFQLHRIIMVSTLVLSVVAFLVIFDFLDWEFELPELHPLLGFITICLVALNPIVALMRPKPDSRYRYIFRWVHGMIGHGAHLLAVVAMYFGVKEPRAEMPSWTALIVVGFGGWRLLADIFLTIANNLSGFKSHDYVKLSTDPSTVAVTDQRYVSLKNKTVQVFIIAVYLAGVSALAGSLISTVNVTICYHNIDMNSQNTSAVELY